MSTNAPIAARAKVRLRMESTQLVGLISRANAGDNEAWAILVKEYTEMLWGVTRRFRMNDAQRADAVQTTWLRLFEHLADIRQPERLAGWLATTVRRACLESLGESKREHPVESLADHLDATDSRLSDAEQSCPEKSAVRRDHEALVRLALAELPSKHRRLIDLVVCSPDVCYESVSEQLGMPHGSIGPTRARLLARIRVMLEAAGLNDMALT